MQIRWPDYRGGANKPSLLEAQRNFAELGSTEQRFSSFVRPAAVDEPVEPGWRPADLDRDGFERDGIPEAPWPDDRTELYWWRPSYWRRQGIQARSRTREETWADVAEELVRAAEFLQHVEPARAASTREWLANNELGVALDELAEVDFEPGHDFWLRLERAAAWMALDETNPVHGESVRIVNEHIRRIRKRDAER